MGFLIRKKREARETLVTEAIMPKTTCRGTTCFTTVPVPFIKALFACTSISIYKLVYPTRTIPTSFKGHVICLSSSLVAHYSIDEYNHKGKYSRGLYVSMTRTGFIMAPKNGKDSIHHSL